MTGAHPKSPDMTNKKTEAKQKKNAGGTGSGTACAKQARGRILKGVGGLYSVLMLDNGREGTVVECRARGVFRYEHMTPTVGDYVTLRISDEKENDVMIESIGERKNCFVRPAVANLDILFTVVAAARPDPLLLSSDKITAAAEYGGAEPVIVVTKADLNPERAAEIARIYTHAGLRVFVLSSASGEGTGEIRAYLRSLAGRTAAFAGASGVGKSTLMNLMFPDTAERKTGAVSARIGRGRQTTREVELFLTAADGGTLFIADTPGFGLLDFEHFDMLTLDSLPQCFPEIAPFTGKCRYRKCTHLCEEGCAVIAAVKNGEIESSRHESYVELYRELKAGKQYKLK